MSKLKDASDAASKHGVRNAVLLTLVLEVAGVLALLGGHLGAIGTWFAANPMPVVIAGLVILLVAMLAGFIAWQVQQNASLRLELDSCRRICHFVQAKAFARGDFLALYTNTLENQVMDLWVQVGLAESRADAEAKLLDLRAATELRMDPRDYSIPWEGEPRRWYDKAKHEAELTHGS